MFRILLVSFLIFSSCAERLVSTSLVGKYWAVQNVVYEDSLYGLFFFRNNGMLFKENGECSLPYFSHSLNRISKWEYLKGNSEEFEISLSGSDKSFLDGVYKAKLVFDSLDYNVLVLHNDRIKLICNSEK